MTTVDFAFNHPSTEEMTAGLMAIASGMLKDGDLQAPLKEDDARSLARALLAKEDVLNTLDATKTGALVRTGIATVSEFPNSLDAIAVIQDLIDEVGGNK